MGPVWDFDISSGNVNYQPIVNPTVPWMQTQAIWYKQLFTDPGFHNDVVTQWNALKNNGVFASWTSSIAQQATMLAQSEQNNFNRWPILGERVWPNEIAEGSYRGEVIYLLNWINTRMSWLDSQFNNKTASTVAILGGPTTAYAGNTVTYQVQVTGSGAVPTGLVTLVASGTVLGSAQIDGGGHAVVSVPLPLAGTYNVVAIYNGNNTYGFAQSTPIALTVNPAQVLTNTVLTTPKSTYAQGNTFNFTALVTDASSSTQPTGTLAISYAGQVLASASLINGAATFDVPSYFTAAIPAGTYQLTATYSGDTAHAGSAGTETITLVTQ